MQRGTPSDVRITLPGLFDHEDSSGKKRRTKLGRAFRRLSARGKLGTVTATVACSFLALLWLSSWVFGGAPSQYLEPPNPSTPLSPSSTPSSFVLVSPPSAPVLASASSSPLPSLAAAETSASSLNHSVWDSRAEEVREAMRHAWKGYKLYAWGKDQLLPVSHSFSQWFNLGLTLVDGLDTLFLMELTTEFEEAREWVAKELTFDQDTEVNLFETTIRVLGAMLSTYHLSHDKVFLDKAIDLGDRLMVAFQTPSGVPLSDVNLGKRTAKGPAWSSFSSTSEVTTIQLELTYLSHLTGDPKYRLAGAKVMEVVEAMRPADGLLPMWINPSTGHFDGSTITLGARGDSYYEYLLKQWIQTGMKDEHMKQTYLHAIESVITQLIRRSEPSHYAFVAERHSGQIVAKMDHLVCFLSGVLALGASLGLGGGPQGSHMKLGKELAESCYQMYAQMPTGLAPEIVMWNTAEGSKEDLYVKDNDAHNLLRPETVESLFILWRLTGDVKYREMGYEIFKAFEKYSKVESGGYSSLQSVKTIPPPTRDKMESFFLGETLKYFYLLFTPDLSKGDLGKVVFNTEAHPFPILFTE